MKAWYFSKVDKKLRYGDDRIIEAGKMHTVSGTPELCNHGLHGSERLIDALVHAPGPYTWRVDISRKLDVGDDKLCGQRRKYLWGFDASDVLREFARKQALINIEKITPYCSGEDYAIIIKWLKTGDDKIKSAAWSAALSAARSAARSAAWSAAESAAWSAAESAARSVAWSAALSAARSAARSAAESAARSAALSAARSAARSAAGSAAWSAASDLLQQMIEDEAKKRGII